MSLITLNQIKKFENIGFLAKQVVTGFITGMHRSPFHGFSVEFSEHRLYNQGDSTKNIDWKLFARSEKLFIKRYEEETNLRCQLVMDASSSMYYPKESIHNKLNFSILAGASIAYMLKKQRDAVGLSVYSDELDTHIPAKSNEAHMQFVTNTLERLARQNPSQAPTKTAKVLHQIAESIPKRSLVVLFSDLLGDDQDNEELVDALQHLKHNKHEVIIIQTLHKSSESDFEFENRPYLFTDVESGEKIHLRSPLIKEEYQRKQKEIESFIKLKCAQYKIDLIAADIEANFGEVLLPYLLKRQQMQH